jgi:hypothetical protein
MGKKIVDGAVLGGYCVTAQGDAEAAEEPRPAMIERLYQDYQALRDEFDHLS